MPLRLSHVTELIAQRGPRQALDRPPRPTRARFAAPYGGRHATAHDEKTDPLGVSTHSAKTAATGPAGAPARSASGIEKKPIQAAQAAPIRAYRKPGRLFSWRARGLLCLCNASLPASGMALVHRFHLASVGSTFETLVRVATRSGV